MSAIFIVLFFSFAIFCAAKLLIFLHIQKFIGNFLRFWQEKP